MISLTLVRYDEKSKKYDFSQIEPYFDQPWFEDWLSQRVDELIADGEEAEAEWDNDRLADTAKNMVALLKLQDHYHVFQMRSLRRKKRRELLRLLRVFLGLLLLKFQNFCRQGLILFLTGIRFYLQRRIKSKRRKLRRKIRS